METIYTKLGEIPKDQLEIRKGIEHGDRGAQVHWTEYYLIATGEQVRRDVEIILSN